MINYVTTLVDDAHCCDNSSLNTESGTILKVMSHDFTKEELFSKLQQVTFECGTISKLLTQQFSKVELF